MMGKQISVSWVSFNNDPFERQKGGEYTLIDDSPTPGPTLEFLFGEDSPIAGRVTEHFLFVRRPTSPEPATRSIHPHEAEVADALIQEIRQRPHAPKVNVIWWESDAPPTDHEELFVFTARELANIRHQYPNAKIAVNLSPGTPAAQTVLLLALQARIAGENVQAYQGTPRARRRAGQASVREVPWNLLATISATPVVLQDIRARGDAWQLQHARSPRLREVAQQVKTYAGVPFPVLIIGSRGTGKTDIARKLRDGFNAWQAKSPREEWMHLNCAEFQGDANMLRSTLFGHQKGAFTGANVSKPGLLELAGDDSVFLDEIHWMDFQAQGLLLLALQRGGSIRAIGAKTSQSLRFRLIAATNQSRSMLREKLMPDFFDRISDLVIELPDLRECREDFDDIWESVFLRACEELLERDPTRVIGANARALLAEVRPHQKEIMRALRLMRLPGNYRDMERLARRLLVSGLSVGRPLSLTKANVDAELRRLGEEESAWNDQLSDQGLTLIDELPTPARCERHLRDVQASKGIFPAEQAISEWERRLIVAAHAVSGSGVKAAELIGMNPRTYNAKLQEVKGKLR